jgi:hypothetical protein
MIIADGFNEAEAVSILSALREAGIYTKSIGLTSGLMTGIHGIPVMPDHPLIDLAYKLDVSSIQAVILPGEKRSFTKLEADPRIHRLLRQVIAQQGFIATNERGYRVLKHAFGQEKVLREASDDRFLLRSSPDQTVGTFAQTIVRRLRRP